MQTTREAAALFAVVALACGCQHRGPPTLGLSAPTPPVLPINLKMLPYKLSVDPPAIDVAWLDSDEFLPPGARRIGGKGVTAASLCRTGRTRFPSTDILAAPDGGTALICQSMGSKRLAIHWLLWWPRAALDPNILFRTTKAFDVVWSPDSRHVAVTHFVGDNRSEVVVTSPERELNAPALDVRVVLTEHFTDNHLEGPCFMKAYGWTDSSLVVRGVGRSAVAPYSIYGFEVLIDPRRLDDPYAAQFLRGFQRDEPEPRVAAAVGS